MLGSALHRLYLIVALAANIIANLKFPALLDAVPVLGVAVWAVILLTAVPLQWPLQAALASLVGAFAFMTRPRRK